MGCSGLDGQRDPLPRLSFELPWLRATALLFAWGSCEQPVDLCLLLGDGAEIGVQLAPGEYDQQLSVETVGVDQAREEDRGVSDDELHIVIIVLGSDTALRLGFGLAAGERHRPVGIDPLLAR
jgi:hypothetical protein